MTDARKIEAIAKALWIEADPQRADWKNGNKKMRERYLQFARAVLRALQELEEMDK